MKIRSNFLLLAFSAASNTANRTGLSKFFGSLFNTKTQPECTFGEAFSKLASDCSSFNLDNLCLANHKSLNAISDAFVSCFFPCYIIQKFDEFLIKDEKEEKDKKDKKEEKEEKNEKEDKEDKDEKKKISIISPRYISVIQKFLDLVEKKLEEDNKRKNTAQLPLSNSVDSLSIKEEHASLEKVLSPFNRTDKNLEVFTSENIKNLIAVLRNSVSLKKYDAFFDLIKAKTSSDHHKYCNQTAIFQFINSLIEFNKIFNFQTTAEDLSRIIKLVAAITRHSTVEAFIQMFGNLVLDKNSVAMAILTTINSMPLLGLRSLTKEEMEEWATNMEIKYTKEFKSTIFNDLFKLKDQIIATKTTTLSFSDLETIRKVSSAEEYRYEMVETALFDYFNKTKIEEQSKISLNFVKIIFAIGYLTHPDNAKNSNK